ncbi:MAG: hypothetical protein ACI8XC_003018 [Gammaproteobacteria bacterium]
MDSAATLKENHGNRQNSLPGGLLPVECHVSGKIGIALFLPKKSVR